MARRETHPRLTPLRALDLLRQVERASARARQQHQCEAANALDDVARALASHVKAALAAKRRRHG